MDRVAPRLFKSLPGLLLFALAGFFAAKPAAGQANPEAAQKVVELVKSAMDAYGNLDLENATGALEEALGYAPDLDKTTLARLYIAYGTIRVGGSGDNAGGQRDLVTALCLDATVSIDPLMSSPDIDSVFAAARAETTPENCQQVLSTIVLPSDVKLAPPKAKIIEPGVPPCGIHTPLDQQRQRFEVPLYLEADPMLRSRLAKVVLKYSFDGSRDFREMMFTPQGSGYSAQLTCDGGQIRVYDPSGVSYYIEGYDSLGNLICGYASAQGPQVVVMAPDAPNAPAVPGMSIPKECTPCAPWDQTCGQVAKAQEGDVCDAQTPCAEGLKCGDAGICEKEEGKSGEARGPKKFYVDVLGGVGFGAMGVDMSSTSFVDSDNNTIAHPTSQGGFAWGGVPIRLSVGFKIKDWVSVEAGLRLDVTKLGSVNKDAQSCLDAAGGDESALDSLSCLDVDGVGPGDPGFDDVADQSIALTAPYGDTDSQPVYKTTPHATTSWLVNARARFRLLQKGGLQISAFAGLGYGHIMYLVKGSNDQNFYPAPGFFDIEIGPGLRYYFNDHVGLAVEVPIDLVVGDGWALNFDVALGLSFGF
jgi:hypothetical protein